MHLCLALTTVFISGVKKNASNGTAMQLNIGRYFSPCFLCICMSRSVLFIWFAKIVISCVKPAKPCHFQVNVIM